jgi:hypothetical protein
VGDLLHIATHDRQFGWDWQGGGLMKPQSCADPAVLAVLRMGKTTSFMAEGIKANALKLGMAW